ncbi:hypothetical protein ABZ934_31360 [Streptomyces sp. NPDC046557]|uniref:hypothetical protein n=1 Tax=Streptomyces sp. NPDC046557 TaxID=3155372 RepID=UPI003404D9DF
MRGIEPVSFTLCHRGHRGVRVRLLPGRFGITVPNPAKAPWPVSVGERDWERMEPGWSGRLPTESGIDDD